MKLRRLRPHGPQQHVERRLRRMMGMTPDQLQHLHAENENLQWSVRCWNCKKQNTGVRKTLCTCEHCHVDLWSRP